jgi:hypothetical protein
MNYIPVYVARQAGEESNLESFGKTTVDYGLWLCKNREELVRFIQNFNKAFNGHKYYDFDEPRRIYVDGDMWEQLFSDSNNAVNFLPQFPEGFHKKLPQFVKMGGIALRHCHGGERWGAYGSFEEPSTYFRDAGCWGVEYEWRHGLLFSVSDMESLNDQLLVETTKEEWMKSNEGYI